MEHGLSEIDQIVHDHIARQLINDLKGAHDVDDNWQLASLAEAYLAVNDIDNAARYFADYATHEKTNAFALTSTIRQLEEVWRLKAGTEGADPLLIGLKAALAQKKEGRIQLSGDEIRAIKNANSVPHMEPFEQHLESLTKGGKYVPLAYLQRMVRAGEAVVAIKHKSTSGYLSGDGDTVGTGFLIDGADFGHTDSSKSYVLTNAHVIWDSSMSEGHEGLAIHPDAADLVFEGGETAEDRRPFGCKVIWQSPSSLYDATLVELSGKVENIRPLALSSDFLPERPDTNKGIGTELTILGHPEGGDLSIGLVGSLEDIKARLLDYGPKGNDKHPSFIHYSVPTEPGNSGSPVLETEDWKVVGLHHAGFDERNGRPRLNGQVGRHHANEGIYIHSIKKAVKEADKTRRTRGRKWRLGRAS